MTNKETKKRYNKKDGYHKEWYSKNKEIVRANVKRKYYEEVTKKRMEEALASISDDDWKVIPNFENYRVNKKGEIINKFGKLLKPGSCSNGYLHVSLSNGEAKAKHMYVHKLVWMAFNGEIPEGLLVCHKDTDRTNNSIENLCLMTHKENFNKPLTIEHFKESQIKYPRQNIGRNKKNVYQYDTEGNLVNTWESITSTKNFQ